MSDFRFIFPHLVPAGMVLARLSGIFLYAPILSSPMIPRTIKALLVFSLTLAVYPAMIPYLQAQGAYDINYSIWTIVPILGLEILVGLVLGFLAMLPLAGIQLAGHKMGQQFGMAVAQEADPNLDSTSSAVGIILFYMALAVFLNLGGLHALVAALLHTFTQIPIAGIPVHLDLIDIVVSMLHASFELAIRVAAPVLCIMFLQAVALGFVNRTAPAFNILSLGFPLRVIIGMSVTLASLEFMYEATTDSILDNLNSLFFVFGN